MINILINNLNLLNEPTFIELIDPELGYETAIEKKARYIKGQTAKFATLSLSDLQDMTNDDEVTIAGMFLHEAQLVISRSPKLYNFWEQYKPENVSDIVFKSIQNFNTIKNFETYPMDILCCQVVVSECIRNYFEDIYDNFTL